MLSEAISVPGACSESVKNVQVSPDFEFMQVPDPWSSQGRLEQEEIVLFTQPE